MANAATENSAKPIRKRSAVRGKCAILPWHTLHAAFNSLASISTEAQDDPLDAPIGGA